MKLDYKFIKQLLEVMENYDEHQITMEKLMDFMAINDENVDKFAGHIKILVDYNCLDASSMDLGFKFSINGSLTINSGERYRLTARGYEFLDILKQDTIFNKIKDHAISTAFEVGKSLLTEYLVGFTK